MTHRPTGITVRIDGERSQHANRRTCRSLLEAKVTQRLRSQQESVLGDYRRTCVGSGQRGDKIKTYRTQNDQVTNHKTGAKASLRKVLSGFLV